MSLSAQLGTVARFAMVLTSVMGSVAALPREARACSFAVQSIEASYPVPTEQGVPTNLVLFAYGAELDGSLLALETADGREVPVDVVPAETSGFDIFPTSELLPNHDYVLVSRSANANRIPFTTGAGSINQTEELAVPNLELTELTFDFATCGTLARLCSDVALAPATFLEMRLGTEVLSMQHPTTFFRRYSQPLPEGACLKIRARDARGNRSPEATICSDAVETKVVQAGVTCESIATPPEGSGGGSGNDGASPRPSNGCALGTGDRAPAAPAGTALLAALAGLLVVTRGIARRRR
jgi:hypothetical protein